MLLHQTLNACTASLKAHSEVPTHDQGPDTLCSADSSLLNNDLDLCRQACTSEQLLDVHPARHGNYMMLCAGSSLAPRECMNSESIFSHSSTDHSSKAPISDLCACGS